MASSKTDYHVFLNFRGTDVRNNFLSHLYTALDQKGIRTFKDSEELWKGEQISPALMRAIEKSCIAIIVFSKDYASSRWCLKELVKIMECKDQKELIVLPVFYKVEPREVREGREAYGRAMAEHETKFGKDSETVKRWKEALFDTGNLSGWDFNDGDEAELIRDIVEKVSSRLERTTPLHVAEHQVGIDSRVQEVISLSQKESDGDDVLIIGLWGPGGIGKTTIAKAIYNTIERQFQGSSFLDRVRETSNKSDGLVDLQRQLLSQILSPRHPTVYTKDGGISLIRERLCCKKVLLVLDDVDQLDQLKALAGGGDWFGKGSRIFVTSRDKHLLISHGIKCVHEVKTLDDDEALDLFVWHAFKNSKKPEIRKDLIDGALHYASGLPLALEVLGSFLYGRNELAWESALRELSNNPHEAIDRILKISFDGLEKNAREIFLDIACFFKGKSIEYIKKVLDSCDLETTIGVDTLTERSLIRNEHGTLQMHDLVQLMGKNIVNQEYPDNPGKRSRLWLFEDVLDILLEDTGTDAIKAIVLDLPTPEERSMSLEEITIKGDAFRNMTTLKMLILPEVHISSEGPVRLPNNLRWLKWPNAPLLEFGSKLIGIDVQKSHIRDLEGKIKHFRNLKYINFSQCKSLVSVPNFSSAPNLESLYLDGCKSLVEVHQSVASLDKLKFLSLQFCSNLSVFPNTLKTKSLEALDLFGCSKLEKFSDMVGKLEHLEELDLGRTAIKELPASIENLLSLKKLNLIKCKKLATLPSNVYKLQSLEHLDLGGCSNFVTFPKNLEDSTDPNGNPGFRKLKRLELYGCNLREVKFLESYSSFPKLGHLDLSENKFACLPTCINKYKYLEHLIVEKCKRIQKIPQLPPNVHFLSANCCRSLQGFPDLSSLSSDCCSVNLSSCHKLFREGANMAHALSLEGLRKMRNVDICLIGKEMPEWFFHGEDSSISFTVPWDLHDKWLGLALCFVLGPKGGKAARGFADVRIHVNGYMVTAFAKGVHSMDSDHVWMGYFPCSKLWIGKKRLRDDCCHIQVNFVPETEVELKKCGFRPICEQQEDDQRIVLEPHQPMKTNWFPEIDFDEDDWIDTEEEESSSETDDELIEAIGQEKEKQGLFKADKIGPLEGRDSEEDNWIDTEEEESSSESDDELIKAIDQEKEIRELVKADKLVLGSGSYRCEATEDLCPSLRTLTRTRFLRRQEIRRY